MNRRVALFIVMLTLAAAACSSPPADVVETDSVPTEAIQQIMLCQNGQIAPGTYATVYADLRSEFSLPVKMGGPKKPATLSSAVQLPAALRQLRGDLPTTTLLIVLTDTEVGDGRQAPRNGLVSLSQRVILASTANIDFDDDDGDNAGANLLSRMVLHLVAHAWGVGHNPSDKCLMHDWRDDVKKLATQGKAYCAPALTRLDPILRSGQLEKKKIEF